MTQQQKTGDAADAARAASPTGLSPFGSSQSGIAIAGRCTMGVGCDEYGVCYAEAHGEPERCPLNQPEQPK